MRFRCFTSLLRLSQGSLTLNGTLEGISGFRFKVLVRQYVGDLEFQGFWFLALGGGGGSEVFCSEASTRKSKYCVSILGPRYCAGNA